MKQWILPTSQPDVNLPGVSKPIAGILAMRGITGSDAEEFLSDAPKTAHDPFRMKGMDEAVDLLLKTLEEGKKICVFGDYDADGISATSLLTEILTKMGGNVCHYIPSRFTDGYGLSKQALAKIAAGGTKLVLTCDCGIGSIEEVRMAKLLGMEIIVTDHHTPGEQLPDCIVLNPKQPACNYPEKGLCGTGVAFKLTQALSVKSLAKGSSGKMIPLSRKDMLAVMDYVAIATIGDIVPLQGENRTLVKYGLRRMNEMTRMGIAALRETARIEGRFTGDNLAYAVVPRLNACGRVASAEAGIHLFRVNTLEEARKAAETLEEYNNERKRYQDEAFRLTESLVNAKEVPALIFEKTENAHEGILGIVAGRLKDLYTRPAILVKEEGNNYKGSGRAPDGMDLFALLEKASHLFTRFGGHKGACGLTFAKENYEEIKRILTAEAEKLMEKTPDVFIPRLTVDWIAKPEDITLELVGDLERMAPFGAGNPEPLFAMQNCIPEDVQLMGQENAHVRFRFAGIPCVLFRVSEEQKKLLWSGKPISVCGIPVKNVWKDRVTLQFRVTDIQ